MSKLQKTFGYGYLAGIATLLASYFLNSEALLIAGLILPILPPAFFVIVEWVNPLDWDLSFGTVRENLDWFRKVWSETRYQWRTDKVPVSILSVFLLVVLSETIKTLL